LTIVRHRLTSYGLQRVETTLPVKSTQGPQSKSKYGRTESARSKTSFVYDPPSKKLIGRWIGIAWNHGDDFTYKIWTTPDNDWKQGREIIRNVVMRREEKKFPTDAQLIPTATYDTFTIEKEKTVKCKGRKRKRVTSKADAVSTSQELNIPEGHIKLPQLP
jgi:hypothetical protein